jgi:hypothetical protein
LAAIIERAQQGAFGFAMQRLTPFDVLWTLQSARPGRIVIYDRKNCEFYLAESLQGAKEKLGAILQRMASKPHFLEPADGEPYVVMYTEETGKLLPNISSKTGWGLTKAEMRRAVAAGYMMSPEDLRVVEPLAPRPSGPPAHMLMKYDIEQINKESAEEQALWPEWQRRLEKALDGYRLQEQQLGSKAWGELLDGMADEDWNAIWETHPDAAQIAWEFTELEKQGKL